MLLSADAAFELNAVFADPVRAVLLWVFALRGKLTPQLCRLIGLREVDPRSIEALYGPELNRLRAVPGLSQQIEETDIAAMLRCQTAGLALTSRDAKSVLNAARAAAALPRWVLYPELYKLEREARNEECTARLIAGKAKRLRAEQDYAEALEEQAAKAEAITATADQQSPAATCHMNSVPIPTDPITSVGPASDETSLTVVQAQTDSELIQETSVEAVFNTAAGFDTSAQFDSAALLELAGDLSTELSTAKRKTPSVVQKRSPKVKSRRRARAR